MLPSGEQVAIAHGDQRAVVTEVGATLRTYVKGGVSVVEGFAGEEVPTHARGQVLYPWPNRIGGEWTFSGRTASADDRRPRTRHRQPRADAVATVPHRSGQPEPLRALLIAAPHAGLPVPERDQRRLPPRLTRSHGDDDGHEPRRCAHALWLRIPPLRCRHDADHRGCATRDPGHAPTSR